MIQQIILFNGFITRFANWKSGTSLLGEDTSDLRVGWMSALCVSLTEVYDPVTEIDCHLQMVHKSMELLHPSDADRRSSVRDDATSD